MNFPTQEAFVPWYLHPVHSKNFLQPADNVINNDDGLGMKSGSKKKKLRKKKKSSQKVLSLINIKNDSSANSLPSVPSHAVNTDKGIMVKRYYHLFCKGELEGLMSLIPNEVSLSKVSTSKSTIYQYPLLKQALILRSGFDRENWFMEIQKK
jgi:hypothetical protein